MLKNSGPDFRRSTENKNMAGERLRNHSFLPNYCSVCQEIVWCWLISLFSYSISFVIQFHKKIWPISISWTVAKSLFGCTKNCNIFVLFLWGLLCFDISEYYMMMVNFTIFLSYKLCFEGLSKKLCRIIL